MLKSSQFQYQMKNCMSFITPKLRIFRTQDFQSIGIGEVSITKTTCKTRLTKEDVEAAIFIHLFRQFKLDLL